MQKFNKENSIRNITKSGKTSFQKYKHLVTGDVSLLAFLLTEFITCVFGPIPGAIGIFLRRKTYPLLFKKCGKGIIIGSNCIFRYPAKIEIGDNVIIDDNCLIDARGAYKKGVTLENGVIINRGTTIKTKSGDIIIGNSVTIGANSSLISWDGIVIGEGCAIAPACYISAGKYDIGNIEIPILSQETYCTGPIIIEKNVWIATRSTILDGVTIGQDSIISAGSIISQKVPPKSVVQGNPAKVIFIRR